MITLIGDVNSVPSNLKNPFDSTKIDSMHVLCIKSCINDKFVFSGKIEFKNGNTIGAQKFEGSNMVDVLKQMYSFVEQLK